MQPSTRRDFLRTTSTAAVSAAVLSGISSRAHAAGDETINIALVGCGGRGTQAATQALSTDGKVKLIALADAFEDHLYSALRKIEGAIRTSETTMIDVPPENMFVGFEGYQKVLELADLDLVILATPPGFRPIHFEEAVKRGKHVFMEKPVAVDAPGVRKVLAAAQEATAKNLKVGVGLQRHHQPCYLEAIEKIHNGEIGDLLALRVYWNSRGVWEPRKTREECKTEMEYQMRNWYYYNWLGGDHINEQHIHNLDVGCWMKGKDGGSQYPVSANGMGGRQVRTDKRYGEIYDHHYVEYTFADGSIMASQCRHIPDCWNPVDEHAHGTKGTAHLDANPRSCKIDFNDGTKWQFDGETKTPYQIEHDHLFHAIRNDISYNEADYGAHSTLTAILGRMCTYSGQVITWDQALNSQKSIMPQTFAFDADPPTLPDADGEYPIPMPGKTKVL
jgi:myo-inositol 2-dehydrogenase/D-chiro-inositol 1-dehydrogenase